MASPIYDIVDSELRNITLPQFYTLLLDDAVFTALRGELRTPQGLPLDTKLKNLLVQLRDGRTIRVRSDLDPTLEWNNHGDA